MFKKLIHDIKTAITDPERDLTERLYICLFLSCEVPIFVDFIGDLVIGENLVEIIVLILLLIANPILTLWGLYCNKIRVASMITTFFFLIGVLPVIFFFGGGIEGGGIFWIIFAFVFVGFVLAGVPRLLAFIWLILFTLGCFSVEYFHPELIMAHTKESFYIDAAVSVISVGFIVFCMTMIQKGLFMGENTRAKNAVKKAEELSRAQNRFFSSMSHEIRTPINSILGLNELILRDTSASDEIVKDASGIQGAGKMLLSLINDILDFSKMEAGSMDIVPVDYRVGDMLSEVVNMIWAKAQEKDLRLEVTIDPTVPSVLYGDEIRIRQVIINLLNNAVKYTKEGMVKLHMECAEADEEHVMLHISVSDTGMGIKKEALPYLFDAFKRVDQEKNRMIEGTGLGLSIVKQIVELMDGSISVNSVYGEGSEFTVVLQQGVTNAAPIGELNIHSQTNVRTRYESKFKAPEAAILIVDDNEMNLEVESKLLADTQMTIDLAVSGKRALEMSQNRRYDAILMDHLMPEMDGIRCLELIRKQTGGLNRTTPVIVLTANAGSENRELYNLAGFDGYLVKPVSGEALEEVLLKFISKEKLIISDRMVTMHEDINASKAYSAKNQVVITSTSMSDLPDRVIRKLNLNIIPYIIRTDEGTFKDGEQLDSDEMMRYFRKGGYAESFPPTEASYTEFFAAALKNAHSLVHISITSDMSEDFHVASEAAKSFENVTVIDSECLSSATGILVLIAHKLAQQGATQQEIVDEIEMMKKRVKCSFVIDTTDYMMKKRLISSRVHRVAKALNLHPCLRFKNGKGGIGGIWIGRTSRAYRRYLSHALPAEVTPDNSVVFITYVDMPTDTLLWIKEELTKKAQFERVVFQQASASISSNCGPGTFGVLYFVKSNKTYNIGTYFDRDDVDEYETYTPDAEEGAEDAVETDLTAASEAPTPEPVQKKWYEGIPGIDSAAAVSHCGSEDALKTVLKLFYDSHDIKVGEIGNYYDTEDWENYTIKVHALKSSARIIGADTIADHAQALEDAGKAADVSYIREHHDDFMREYKELADSLGEIFAAGDKAKEAEKPAADEYLLQSVYDGLREAAGAMDCDAIGEILGELSEYAVSGEDAERLEKVGACAAIYDYEGILSALDE